MWEYFKPFNYVQTIIIHVCKQISNDSYKNKITNKLLTHKSHEYLFNCVQTNELWLV